MGPVEKALREAWEIIKEPEKRCSKEYALDVRGKEVDPNSFLACKWCSAGAVIRASKSVSIEDKAFKYLDAATLSFGTFSSITFNDLDNVNNPPKMFEKAIEMAAKDKA